MSKTAKLVFLILIYVGCWGLIYKGVLIVMLLVFSVLPNYMKCFFLPKKDFKFEHIFLSFFLIAIICNLISCYVNRGQTFIESLSNTELLWFFYILSFYVYYHIGFSIKQIEKNICILYKLFCFSYILQYYVFYPYDLFYMLALQEDAHRFRLIGQFVLYLGYFFHLNQIIIGKPTLNHIASLMLGFFVVILLGFRSGLVALIIVSCFMLYKIRGLSANAIKYLLLTISFLGLIILSPIGGELINTMIERNEGENFTNEDYIRVRQFSYFTQDHFKNTSEWFWGTGIPSPVSKYGKYIESLTDRGNVTSVAQWRDWGLLGLSWIMGIPMFLVMLFLIFYMIFKRVPPNYYYISSVYFFMLLTSVTTVEVYRNGAFVFHGLLIYQMLLIKQQLKNKPL